MVAITVILAAVIGVFVMGLGDELGDSAAPTATMSVADGEYTESGESGANFVIEHSSGDTIDLSELSVLVNGTDDTEFFEGELEGEISSGEHVEILSQDSDLEVAESSPPAETGVEALNGIDEEDSIDGERQEVEAVVALRHDPSDSIITEDTIILAASQEED